MQLVVVLCCYWLVGCLWHVANDLVKVVQLAIHVVCHGGEVPVHVLAKHSDLVCDYFLKHRE